MPNVHVLWHDEAVKVWAAHSPQAAMIMAKATGRVVSAMKAAIPVSPVYPVSGATVPGGTRRGGDFPLAPSGTLRSSVRVARLPNGRVLIGPTASYARFVNDGTSPHEIRSHGPWPLRNRATGQVFGPVVHHPGTTGVHFIEKAAHAIDGMVVVR